MGKVKRHNFQYIVPSELTATDKENYEIIFNFLDLLFEKRTIRHRNKPFFIVARVLQIWVVVSFNTHRH